MSSTSTRVKLFKESSNDSNANSASEEDVYDWQIELIEKNWKEIEKGDRRALLDPINNEKQMDDLISRTLISDSNEMPDCYSDWCDTHDRLKEVKREIKVLNHEQVLLEREIRSILKHLKFVKTKHDGPGKPKPTKEKDQFLRACTRLWAHQIMIGLEAENPNQLYLKYSELHQQHTVKLIAKNDSTSKEPIPASRWRGYWNGKVKVSETTMREVDEVLALSLPLDKLAAIRRVAVII
ncbi:hypothetical protein [Undibacterium sp. Ren11W]|uniref:hypothetical protein n=1 Tax=Undibacterium sp. Ren11W TaxID=3413045 RepID=UPI003BF2438F